MGERNHSSRQPSKRDRSHAEAQSAFPEYAAAVAQGLDQRACFPDVAAHLDHCSTCRAELAELLELVLPLYEGQFELPADLPALNTSFLRPREKLAPLPARPWIIDEARRLIVAFSEALLATMQPAPLVRAARGDALYRYQPELPEQLSLTIDVFAVGADAANVQVLLDVPGLDPLDQSGVPVTLRAGDIVRADTTSETGSVTFSAVPMRMLPAIKIEIALPPP
jgi:hypothetical protein